MKIRVDGSARVELPVEDVAFCVRDHVTGRPIRGVTVVVEVPDGGRRLLISGEDGRVATSRPGIEPFRLREVRTHHKVAVKKVTRT